MFWQNQFKTTIPLPPQFTILEGKTCIITGANSGLGFSCAKQMLKAGILKLILAVRSLEKVEAVPQQLRPLTNAALVEMWELDMADYESIRNFAQCCETLWRMDYAILNAGISTTTFTKAKTGHEMAIQVNYISTILLAILLLPILKERGQAHLTVVGSATARQQTFPSCDIRPLLSSFDDPSITPFDANRYGMSKLLGQLAVERLSEYVNAKDVTITLVEPGWVKQTGLYKDLPFVIRMILNLIITACGRPVDQGKYHSSHLSILTSRRSCNISRCSVQSGCNQSWFLHHELCTRSVGVSQMSRKLLAVSRYGEFAYLDEAKAVTDALWNETLDELEFVKARRILQSMRAA